MTTKWHVNRETGESGKCRAEYNCPFGGSFNGHQTTKREAVAMYGEYRADLFSSTGSSNFYFLSDEEHEFFSQGDCGVLAAELYRQTGYPVVAVGVREEGFDGTSWQHVAVRAPDGRLLDVTGIRPESETAKAWKGFGDGEVFFKEIEPDKIDSYLGKEEGARAFGAADPKVTAGKILEALRG